MACFSPPWPSVSHVTSNSSISVSLLSFPLHLCPLLFFSSPLSALSDPLPAAWVNPSPTRRPGILDSHESGGGRFGGRYSSSSVLPLWLIISKRKLITSTNISKAVEMMRGQPDGATAHWLLSVCALAPFPPPCLNECKVQRGRREVRGKCQADDCKPMNGGGFYPIFFFFFFLQLHTGFRLVMVSSLRSE